MIKKCNRQSIRLNNWDYSRPMKYFVTLVIQNRQPYFGHNDHGIIHLNSFGRIAGDEWIKSGQIRDEIKLWDFVVMPNHVHGIVEILDNGLYRNECVSDGYDGGSNGYDGGSNGYDGGSNGYDVGANGHSPLHHHHDPENQSMIIPPKKPKSLSTFIIGYKSAVTTRVNDIMVKHNYPVFTRKNRLWQRNYYDRIIWNPEMMVTIQNYILNNPMNHYFGVPGKRKASRKRGFSG